MNNIDDAIDKQRNVKKKTLKLKFNKLQNQHKLMSPKVKIIEDFVVNKSSCTLSNDELELLNMG